MVQFSHWYDDAVAAVGDHADHLVVATVDADGQPSARVVLLRGIDEDGLCFYTNYESRKGRELAANPRVALLLHWAALGRQVRVTGIAERLTAEQSEPYWHHRARGSQVSAWASSQSEPVADRAALEAEVERAEALFGDADLSLPPFWGGYRVTPTEFEFWEHRDDRLHDRVRYRHGSGLWVVERLAP